MNPLEFIILLCKYDLKHHQIFTQILKIDKENPTEHMRHETLFYLKNRDLSKSDLHNTCLWKCIEAQRRFLRTLEKELLMLIRLEKVTKPFLKSLESTNPQADSCVIMEEIQDHCYPLQKCVNQQRNIEKPEGFKNFQEPLFECVYVCYDAEECWKQALLRPLF